jgi:hypothetical protein
MLLYSIDHLTEEEQRIYDSLIEELAPRIESRAEPRPSAPPAPSTTPRPAAGPPASAPPARSSVPKTPSAADPRSLPQNRKLQGAKPEAVVRLFVECWNKQDFKQEYFCLSDDFKQGKRAQQTMDDYVNSRYERYANRHLTGPISKNVVDISAPVVDGDLASVQVAERHTGKDEDMILYRTYKLHFVNTAWRIINFQTNQTRVRKRV